MSKDTLRGNLMIFSSLILVLIVPKTMFNDTLLNNNLNEFICLFVPAAIYGIKAKGGVKKVFLLKGIKLKTLIISIVLGVLLYLISTMICCVSISLLGFNENLDLRYKYYPLWYLIFSNALIPAVCEETLFRGAFLDSYKGVFFITRIVINALVFTMFHMSYIKMFIILILSMVLSEVAFYTKSILVPIIIHFINNALCEISGYLKWSGIIPSHKTHTFITLILLIIVVIILVDILFRVIDKMDIDISSEELKYDGENCIDIFLVLTMTILGIVIFRNIIYICGI